jgi:hypothetical protein
MNFTLTLLDRVTRVCEKWKTLLMMANGYSTNALFLNLGRIGQGVNPFTDPDLKEYNGLMEYQISTNPFHDFHELIKAGN